MKSKTGKIILTICASLVGLLLIATIILACTHYTATNIVSTKAYAVEVYKSGYEEFPTYVYELGNEKDKAIINDIYAKIEETTKENNLSAMFQGVKKFEVNVKHIQSNMEEVLDMANGSYYIKFMYNNTQDLVIDGENYINPNSSTKETVKYNAIWLEVKNTSNFTEYSAYLVDGTSDEDTSYFRVDLIAQQANLYSYIADLSK